MQDAADIDLALLGARPKTMAALLRYFRDLDSAEEAFQEASLRALQSWPKNGPPRDPAAWLILVGRNAALDGKRRERNHDSLTDADAIADESAGSWADRVDESGSTKGRCSSRRRNVIAGPGLIRFKRRSQRCTCEPRVHRKRRGKK